MSGFSSPVVSAIGEVIRDEIMSDNFVMGVSGWAILKNGNAYFYNITAEGNITSSAVVVEGATGGVFIYSGIPANGNLIGSWAGIAGTDAYGNVYPQGLNVTIGTITGSAIVGGSITGAKFIAEGANGLLLGYSGVPAAGNLVFAVSPISGNDAFGNSWGMGLSIFGSGSYIVVGETGGSPIIFFGSGRSQIHNSSALQVFTTGSGNSGYEQIQILGPEDSTQQDIVSSTWVSSSTDGTTMFPQIQDYYHDPSNVLHQYRTLSYAGNVSIGSNTGVVPGTGTSRTNAAVAESWHLASLGTGFTTSVSDQAPRYRFEGTNGGVVRLDGTVYTSAAVASGASMFVLPTGYRPTLDRRRFVGLTNISGYALGGSLAVVNTTGVVAIGAAANAAGQQICLDGMTFPID